MPIRVRIDLASGRPRIIWIARIHPDLERHVPEGTKCTYVVAEGNDLGLEPWNLPGTSHKVWDTYPHFTHIYGDGVDRLVERALIALRNSKQ